MGNSQEKMQPKAVKNDGESWFKGILFLETVSDDIGQNRFALIAAKGEKGPNDSQPFISFNEISFSWLFHYCIRENVSNRSFAIVRKKPYSLEVLAAVKVASCGFNLETLGLPKMIKGDVKKYKDLDERIKSFDESPFWLDNTEVFYHNTLILINQKIKYSTYISWFTKRFLF